MAGKLESLREAENHTSDSIRLYLNTQERNYTPHWHMPYEMVMIIENEFTMNVDGDHYVLQPGDILIIPSGTLHEIVAPSWGLRHFFLIDRDRMFAVEELRNMEAYFYPYIFVPAGSMPGVTERYERAVREWCSNDRMGHGAAYAELTLMLIELMRSRLAIGINAPAQITTGQERRQMLFIDISAYIVKHCTENLTPESIADLAGYSRYHFERLFQECIGKSFHDFLVEQRLNHCKRLLYQSTDPITEIAQKAGFGSIATFNRLFKEREGMSPRAYRNLFGNGNN